MKGQLNRVLHLSSRSCIRFLLNAPLFVDNNGQAYCLEIQGAENFLFFDLCCFGFINPVSVSGI
jgi:hypothetical protein